MKSVLYSTLFLMLVGCSFSEQKPNFLFIVVDDLGNHDLSVMGSNYYETPNIDRIANEGFIFTNGYASASVCSPSRASLLTGFYPTVHGITDWIGAKYGTDWRSVGRRTKLLPSDYVKYLPHEMTTLPEALKENGYKTFFSGKWHLGSKEEKSLPTDHGFDINVGGFRKGSPASGRYFSPFNNPYIEDQPEEAGMSLSMKLAKETSSFISTNKDKPFLAYLSFYAVHSPIQTTQKRWEKYRNKAESQGISEEGFKMERRLPIRIKQDNPVYAGLIEQTDEAVGQVLKTLDELNLEDNTIVVFVSDNGGVSAGDNFSTSNRPLRGGKGYQWEAGIRVPFFIKAPQLKGLGKKIDTAVSGMDLFPTLLELAGIKSTLDIDGKSLVPLLKNEPFMDRSLFWHYPHYGNQGGDPSSIIREGKWKLIKYWETGFYELYDLSKDIGERDDIILDNPRIATDLIKKLDQWLEATQAKIPVVDPMHDPKKEKEWLEGYKLKLKEKLEEKRSFMLNKEYAPNKDWWGTAVID